MKKTWLRRSFFITCGSILLFCFAGVAIHAQSVATACCLPSGDCLDFIPPAECEESLGGFPNGACAPCEAVECPNAGCIGATGSCNEPHDTPGCDDPLCCVQICELLPHCCTDAWDEDCVAADCSDSPAGIPCCLPDGTCAVTEALLCRLLGGTEPDVDGLYCPGDSNGNGIDDGCPCETELVPATSTRTLAVAVLLLLSASAAVLLWRRRFASRR